MSADAWIAVAAPVPRTSRNAFPYGEIRDAGRREATKPAMGRSGSTLAPMSELLNKIERFTAV